MVSFLVISAISRKREKDASRVGEKTLKALKTKEGIALMLTPEGRAFIATPEFKDMLKTLTREKANQLLGLIP